MERGPSVVRMISDTALAAMMLPSCAFLPVSRFWFVSATTQSPVSVYRSGRGGDPLLGDAVVCLSTSPGVTRLHHPAYASSLQWYHQEAGPHARPLAWSQPRLDGTRLAMKRVHGTARLSDRRPLIFTSPSPAPVSLPAHGAACEPCSASPPRHRRLTRSRRKVQRTARHLLSLLARRNRPSRRSPALRARWA
jgi:hypothetical protein